MIMKYSQFYEKFSLLGSLEHLSSILVYTVFYYSTPQYTAVHRITANTHVSCVLFTKQKLLRVISCNTPCIWKYMEITQRHFHFHSYFLSKQVSLWNVDCPTPQRGGLCSFWPAFVSNYKHTFFLGVLLKCMMIHRILTYIIVNSCVYTFCKMYQKLYTVLYLHILYRNPFYSWHTVSVFQETRSPRALKRHLLYFSPK